MSLCFFGLDNVRRLDTPQTCQRPYCVENTGSLPNSEVKHRKARIVLGWVTAREVLRVLLAFLFLYLLSDIYAIPRILTSRVYSGVKIILTGEIENGV